MGGLVSSDEPVGPHFGLPPRELRPDEVVLYHWSSPHGRGLLTNRRCVLLGHPAPLHRKVLWSQDLEDLRALSVVEGPAQWVTTFEVDARKVGGTGPLAGSTYGALFSKEQLNPDFYVKIDDVVVYKGSPKKCAEIQRRVDAAREGRMMAVLGHVVPYLESP